MKKRLIRIAAAIAAVLLAMQMCSCSKLDSTAKERQTVMKLGEYKIPYEVYRYFVLNHKTDYSGGDESVWTGGDAAALSEKVRSAAEESIRKLYGVFSACTLRGIDPYSGAVDQQVENAVANQKAKYATEEEYIADLGANYQNDSVFRLLTRYEICSNELYLAVVDTSELSSDKERMTAVLQSDEVIRVKQILITRAGRSDKAAQELSREVSEKLQAGADFEAMLAEYGEDTMQKGNPDGYYIMRGLKEKAFEDAAFALSENGVSLPVSTPDGYTIIKRYAKENEYIESHFENLSEQYFTAQFNVEVEKCAASFELTTTKAYEKYDIAGMKF